MGFFFFQLPVLKVQYFFLLYCHSLNLPSLTVKIIEKNCFFPFRHHTQFVCAVLSPAGAGLGFALRPYNMTAREIKYFMFPGELLMQILQCLVLPLIASSVITG